MSSSTERKFPGRDGHDEQGIRTAIALVYIVVIVAFFTWFFATHLQQIH